jgi:hypothetical protein
MSMAFVIFWSSVAAIVVIGIGAIADLFDSGSRTDS